MTDSHNKKENVYLKNQTYLDQKAKEYANEYNKYQEKIKLEKIKKEEKIKYEQDLLRMGNYADSIYNYILKRRTFRRLITNSEINKVVFKFLEVISSKILKLKYMKKMKEISMIKREKIKLLKLIKIKFCENFFKQKIKKKLFEYIKINLNSKKCYRKIIISKILHKREKLYKRSFLNLVKNNFKYYLFRYQFINNQIITKRIDFYRKLFFKTLHKNLNDSIDEKLKNMYIENLKNKIKNLVDY